MTSFFGNLFADLASKAIAGVSQAIKEVVNRFTELQKVSDYTATSMEWVYGLQEALSKAGASVQEVNAAFKAVAFSLDEMKRGGDNPLKELLAAPGNQQFLKGFNKEAATAEETMKRVLVIIGEMPNMIRAVDVAQKLGIPASIAAAAFREGGDALAAAAAAAAKASPDLQAIANSAAAFDTYMRSAIEAIKAWISDNAWAGVKDTIAEIVKLLQLFQGPTSVFRKGPLENFGADALKNLDALQTKMNQFGPEAPPPKRITVTGGTAEDPFARKGGGAAQRDEFERANDQITKHIALMEADTAAVGKGVYEQERLKTETLLMEGVRRKLNIAEGEAIPINEELAAKIRAQAEAAAKAAQKNAEAKYQLQQMNAAAQLVGSALSTAFADAILEGKKLNDVLSQMLKTLARAAINFAIMAPFTPGAGGTAAPFAKLFGFAEGTRSAPGGLALVGERGPELVNLPRGSQVIPNDVLKNSGSIGGSIIYSPAIDARGASVEAVARLAQIMEADRASFATRTVQTIQQARRGRIPGV